MKNAALWNVGALVAAMTVATAVVWVPALRHGGSSERAGVAQGAGDTPLVDHSGDVLPRANYIRIASLSTIADQLLLELCEPDRIAAFTGYSARSGTRGYRFEGKPTLDGMGDLEKVLSLHPDLVLVSRVGDTRPIQRMREAGLVVYDLGEMRGLSTLIPNVHEVAAIIGHPERGEELARALVSEIGAVAADVPPASRKRAIYLSVYGGRLFGGAEGTSAHDVLASAGLLDAATGYRDSPQYATEQVLALDPDVIVTNEGMRPRICEHTGLESLQACRSPGAIVEIDDALIGDPGPGMLDAAQAIRLAVYGPSPVTSRPR